MASQGKCEHHDVEVIFVCLSEGCSESLACLECVTSVHQGHNLEKIRIYQDKKKKEIQQFLQDAKEVLPTFTNKKLILGNKQAENKKMHITAKEKIADRCNQLKECLECIAKEYRNICDEHEKKNTDVLTKYENELATMIDILEVHINKYDNIVKSDITWNIITESKSLPKLKKCPDLPPTTSIEFKNGDKKQNLEKTFGTIDTKEELLHGPTTPVDETSDDELPGTDQKFSFQFPEMRQGSQKEIENSTDSAGAQAQINKLSTSSTEKASDYVNLQPSPSGFVIDADFMQLLQSPNPIFSNIYALCGLVTFSLFNRPECISKSWKLPKSVFKFCVSPVDQTIWYYTTDSNNIYQITTDDSPVHRFTTKEKPRALCMLPDSCLVVAMTGKVVVFKEKWEVQHHNTNKGLSLPCSPSIIAYCHLTDRLAFGVTDERAKTRIRISVTNRKLKFLYKIQDEVEISLSAQSKPDNTWDIPENSFEIQSLSFSEDGNLVVLLENNKIIFYNQSGILVKVLALKVKHFSQFMLEAE